MIVEMKMFRGRVVVVVVGSLVGRNVNWNGWVKPVDAACTVNSRLVLGEGGAVMSRPGVIKVAVDIKAAMQIKGASL